MRQRKHEGFERRSHTSFSLEALLDDRPTLLSPTQLEKNGAEYLRRNGEEYVFGLEDRYSSRTFSITRPVYEALGCPEEGTQVRFSDIVEKAGLLPNR